MPRPRLPALLAVLPLSACVAYVPGSLAERRDTYDVRRVGCLEIAVRAVRDPVLGFTLGNTCHHPVGVDFRNLTVRAWTADGAEHDPTISDPRDELREAVVDGDAQVDVTVDFPVGRVTPSFCVDVGRLDVDEPVPYPPVEMCFRADDDSRRPVPVSPEEARGRTSRWVRHAAAVPWEGWP
jgi:hypothetical protein